MTLGIIGAGRMGRTVARAASAVGLHVLLAGRPGGVHPGCEPRGRHLDPDMAAVRHPARLAEVLADASVVLLALPFPAAVDLLTGRVLHPGRGRTLIDVTNPRFCRDLRLPVGRSGGEVIAASAVGWRTVKAFNTVPADQFAACRLDDRPVAVPVAGDDPAAKFEVFDIARRLGFDAFDAGGIGSSGELESLAVLLSRISAMHDLGGRVGLRIGCPRRPTRVLTVSTPHSGRNS